jgi:hypothetical protein
VTTKNGLKILIEDESGNCTNETRNVVYKLKELVTISVDRHIVFVTISVDSHISLQT